MGVGPGCLSCRSHHYLVLNAIITLASSIPGQVQLEGSKCLQDYLSMFSLEIEAEQCLLIGKVVVGVELMVMVERQ